MSGFKNGSGAERSKLREFEASINLKSSIPVNDGKVVAASIEAKLSAAVGYWILGAAEIALAEVAAKGGDAWLRILR